MSFFKIYIPIDQYKKLLKTYMSELNTPYITAKHYICLKQMKQFEYENNIQYEQVFLRHIMMLLKMDLIYLCYKH